MICRAQGNTCIRLYGCLGKEFGADCPWQSVLCVCVKTKGVKNAWHQTHVLAGINAYLLHVSKGSFDCGTCGPFGGHGVGLTPGAAQAPRSGLGSALGCGAIGTALALLRSEYA